MNFIRGLLILLRLWVGDLIGSPWFFGLCCWAGEGTSIAWGAVSGDWPSVLNSVNFDNLRAIGIGVGTSLLVAGLKIINKHER